MLKEHDYFRMCTKCYGLLKEKDSIKYVKNNPDVKFCDCHKTIGVKIDRNIFDLVQLLNLKGYYTISSCEGIGKRGMSITFQDKHKNVNKKSIPKGFKFYEKSIFSTKEDYNSIEEKLKDNKRIYNWIKNELGDIQYDND